MDSVVPSIIVNNTMFGQIMYSGDVDVSHRTVLQANLIGKNGYWMQMKNEASFSGIRKWEFGNNFVASEDTDESMVPLQKGDRSWGSNPLLSDDADARTRYRVKSELKLDPSAVKGTQPYVGALPPGPAPPEGDWFTNLLHRYNDRTEQ